MNRIDLRLLNDGDLATIPALYPDGTEILDENDNPMFDLTLSVDHNTVIQGVLTRIKTYRMDWYTYPTLGANLEDYIGEQNTRETAAAATRSIVSALTDDGFIAPHNLSVHAVPVNHEEIIFFIRVTYTRDVVTTIPIIFRFSDGHMEVQLQ